ncbi:MAG: hydroxyacid dehydrogenase [Candidatus Moranbacteria bacterium]|nr:hydroxyacid dehydrogenase [Candidatus Moranbacteria bacterium]
MKNIKIAFFEVSKEDREYVEKSHKEKDIVLIEEPLTPESAQRAKDCEIVSVFINSKVDAAVLEALPDVKLIATRSTGFDHINKNDCTARGVRITNVPYYGENTVAEHAFALILALSRNVHKSYVRTLRNDYSIEGLKGFDLNGKTLGVVGTGRIGMHVIRIAKGFGMHVLAFDVHQDIFLSEILHFKYASMEELLAQSDIISLHTPYNESTHHLIDEEAIYKMKPGVLLINTARGGLIDNNALIQGLDKKIIAGAGLDVLEGEELIREEKQLLHHTDESSAKLEELLKNHLLLSQDNVVFTPHIAFYSQEALERILDSTMASIESFKQGALLNEVK